MARGSHARRARRRAGPAILVAAGALLLCVSAALVAHVVGFYNHSDTVGGNLIAREQAAVAQRVTDRTASRTTNAHPASVATARSCPTPHSTVRQAAALLEIPAIGLVAPVLQGDGEGVLAVAVGHDPASSWQAGPGTVVFDGHDVTWFHHLPKLRPGDAIEVVDPCETVRYRVLTGRVESAGVPVANRVGHLVLVTCYPLDALFFTNQRYVLTAIQVGTPLSNSGVATRVSNAQRSPGVPAAGVPAGWSSVSTLADNPTPLGSLHVSGRPSSAWSESPAPLDAATAAQDAFFASVREGEDSTATWSGLHPGLALSQAVTELAGTHVVGNVAAMQTFLNVEGSTVRSATVTDGIVLSDGVELYLTGTFEVSGSHPAASGSFRLISWAVG